MANFQKSYQEKHEIFRDKVICEIAKAIRKSVVTRFRTNEQCLKVTNEDCMFNLSGGGNHYLHEVTVKTLLDKQGNQYDWDVLTTEQICELADELLK